MIRGTVFRNGNFFMDSLPSDEDMLSVGASKRADGGKTERVTKGLEVRGCAHLGCCGHSLVHISKHSPPHLSATVLWSLDQLEYSVITQCHTLMGIAFVNSSLSLYIAQYKLASSVGCIQKV